MCVRGCACSFRAISNNSDVLPAACAEWVADRAKQFMEKKVIGFVDTRWKPKRKSPLEVQIEREDAEYWANKEDEVLEYDYRPQKLILTEAAKHVFARSIHFISSLAKL